MTSRAFGVLVAGASAATFAAVLLIPGVPKADAAPAWASATLAAVTPAPPDPAVEASAYYSGCREARAAGKAPLHRGEPGYRSDMDGDGDGVACEDYGGGGGWHAGRTWSRSRRR